MIYIYYETGALVPLMTRRLCRCPSHLHLMKNEIKEVAPDYTAQTRRESMLNNY